MGRGRGELYFLNMAVKLAFPIDLRNKFRNFITNRGGLYFKDHDLSDLEGAISTRMLEHRFDSPVTYYNYITASEKKEDEFRELLNLITINHTYFFRNEPHFKALKEKILPEIIERKLRAYQNSDKEEKPELRIWSAGCSSGEEPYSIAMIIKDVIGNIEDWNITIFATDASTNVLSRARKGLYGKNTVKYSDSDYLNRYFTEREFEARDRKFEIDDSIKDMVNFAYFNLMDEDYPVGLDVIFFRNVSIYFELETTIKVMSKIYSSLADDGYLFIGYSETLQFMPDKFQMVSWGDSIYYRKLLKGEGRRLEMPKSIEEEKLDIDKVLEEISRAQAIAELEAEAKKAKPSKKIEEILVEIIKSMHLKEYDTALKLIEEAHLADKKAVDPYYLAAEIFMNQGRIEEAKLKLFEALKLNSLFAPAHYLLGCMYIEENVLDSAKECLRKALYIDKKFLIAHFYLALAFKNEGSSKDAIREYRNTLKLLSKTKPEDVVAYSGGFNAATLMSVCRDNLERLKLEQ